MPHPNIGRILSAIGATCIRELDIRKINININNYPIIRGGILPRNYSESRVKRAMLCKEINLTIDIGRGEFTKKFLTCDLSYEYIKINSEYRS